MSVDSQWPLTMSEVKPFDPSFPQEDVERLYRKLGDTRIPSEIAPGAKDDYGLKILPLSLISPQMCTRQTSIAD